MIMNLRLLFTFLLFFLPFIVYLFTSYPNLTFTDNGELTAVAYTLGIAHPSGYPLFTILGHLWLQLPLGLSVIRQLNIFAAFLTAISISVIFNLTLELFRTYKIKTDSVYSYLIAIFSTLSFAFMGLVWEQGLSAEVYSLHLLMISLTLFFTLKAYNTSSNSVNVSTDFKLSEKYYLISAFCLGLSFSNHLTSFLLIPTLLILYLNSSNKINIKSFLILIFIFSLGLSLYLYLPLRSMSNPEFDWGGVSRSFDKFLYHVQGKQYQIWLFTGIEAMKENIPKMLEAIFEYWYIWFVFSVLGFMKLIRNKVVLYSFMALLISNIFYSLNYSIHDISHYFLPSLLILFLILSLGFAYIYEYLKIKKKSANLILSLLLLPVLLFLFNYNKLNHSNDYLVSEYCNIVVDNIDANAIVIGAQWDYWNSAFWYQQRVEGKRKDIIFIEKELLRRTWYPIQLTNWYPELKQKCGTEINAYMKQLELFESDKPYQPREIQASFLNMLNSFIEKFYDQRPIYITFDMLVEEKDVAKNYFKVPDGFAFRLYKKTENIKIDLSTINLKLFQTSIRKNPNHLEKGIVDLAITNLINISRYCQSFGQYETANNALEMAYELDNNNIEILRALKSFK